jgi:hypothetical protein
MLMLAARLRHKSKTDKSTPRGASASSEAAEAYNNK